MRRRETGTTHAVLIPGTTHTMHIGSLRVAVRLYEIHSLKDKRSIIKSLVETTRRKFNISIAEVDDLDNWHKATIGIACVANDAAYVNRVLDLVLDSFEHSPEYDVQEVELEIL